jgi:transposase
VTLAVAVDGQGWPIGWDILPGNTADTVAFVAMVERLRERFHIRRAMVVADRGMVSAATLARSTGHEQAPYDYIVCCRMRQ